MREIINATTGERNKRNKVGILCIYQFSILRYIDYVYENSHKFGVMDGMLAVGLALITVGIGLGIKSKIDKTKVELIKGKEAETVTQGYNKVTFDISGEVIKPGVYRLAGDSRISDAMVLAGGLSASADRDWVEKNINRAKRINDGEKIYIPKKSSNFNLQTSNQIANNKTREIIKTEQVLGVESGGLININSAGVAELDKLEGVGPSIAAKIIEYRQKNGGFRNINELKLVSGIGDKMFEKIKDKVGI